MEPVTITVMAALIGVLFAGAYFFRGNVGMRLAEARNEDGALSTEYVVIMAAVVIVLLAVFATVFARLNQTVDDIELDYDQIGQIENG